VKALLFFFDYPPNQPGALAPKKQGGCYEHIKLCNARHI